jgi:hypothetical protein
VLLQFTALALLLWSWHVRCRICKERRTLQPFAKRYNRLFCSAFTEEAGHGQAKPS